MKIELPPSEARQYSDRWRDRKTKGFLRWLRRVNPKREGVDYSYAFVQITGAFDIYFLECDQAAGQTVKVHTGKPGKPPRKSPIAKRFHSVDTIQMDPGTTALDMLLISLAIPWLCERPDDRDIRRVDEPERYGGPLVRFILALLDIHEVEYTRSKMGEMLHKLLERNDIKETLALKLALSDKERSQAYRDGIKAKEEADRVASAPRKATHRDLNAVKREKASETFKPAQPFRRN